MPNELEELIGHHFADRALLRDALTHGSSSGRRRGAELGNPGQHQRLEFLGDRVLALVIATLLLERYPQAAEGPLTSRSQVLVSTATLAEVADEIGIDRWLQTDLATGRKPAPLSRKMRADACEALIGAMFSDGGLAPARAFIRRFWSARIDAMTLPPRDPKMALQEWALERALPLPGYVLVASEGPPHAPRFRVEAIVQGQAPAAAEGSSKRRAEQAAARKLLTAIAGSPPA